MRRERTCPCRWPGSGCGSGSEQQTGHGSDQGLVTETGSASGTRTWTLTEFERKTDFVRTPF